MTSTQVYLPGLDWIKSGSTVPPCAARARARAALLTVRNQRGDRINGAHLHESQKIEMLSECIEECMAAVQG